MKAIFGPAALFIVVLYLSCIDPMTKVMGKCPDNSFVIPAVTIVIHYWCYEDLRAEIAPMLLESLIKNGHV